ncbi:MAG: TRAP transporter large permease [Synergistaceae bacterium]|jgi:C4-dicarboxylate transporter DctM subunit|nr:TRAP transporter large permease [Synergistaceae bacterium]
MTGLALFGSLAFLLIVGVPVSISVGGATMFTLLMFYPIPVAVVAQRIFTALDSVSIMAIPFFVLAGNLMTLGGISRRLVDFANQIVGNIRGGLCYAAVLACAFFAALSGSGPATVLAVGSMMYPDMVRLGYPKERCAGLLAVAGGLGPVIPPSIIMVVYCTITNTSIVDMFKAGLIVGIVIVAALFGFCAFLGKKENWPKNEVKTSPGDFIISFLRAIPAILLPVIVLGGIYSGLLTPTEAAAVATVYALFTGLFVYRELRLKDLMQTIFNSAKSSAMILFVIATASSFSWFFAYSGMSKGIVNAISALHLPATLFNLVIYLIFLFFGTFLEGISMCVLLVPVLYPVAASLGVTSLHFGVIVCVAGVIGAMTPPVAVNIFAAASVSKLKMGEIAKGELPFFLGFTLVPLIFVLFPQVLQLFF